MSLRNALATAAIVSTWLLLASAPLPRTNGVDSTVQQAMQAGLVPGAQVGIVRNGKLIYNRAYGLAEVAAKRPVTLQTRFEIGSITKQITAAAILQLSEQGKLHLHDPLSRYVPQYPAAKEITIEQLLWQVSGLPDYLDEVPGAAKLVARKPGSLDAALALIKGLPLHFTPGTKWRYSNTNYLLLGAIVADVSHQPFEDYVRTQIFARAGMTRSAFVKDERSLPDMAVGYHVKKNGAFVRGERIRDGWAGGAGAIVSTARDVARWDSAFFAGRIVSMADVRLATSPDRLPSGASTHYGFGWGIGTFEGQPLIWHNGGDDGFTAQNDYFPALHEAFIVLTNAGNFMAGSIANRIFNTVHPAIARAADKPAAGEDPKITAVARDWIHRLQIGDPNRAQLTSKMSAFFTTRTLAFGKNTLGALGEPLALLYRGKTKRDGLTDYLYRVKFKSRVMILMLGIDRRGKIADFGFKPG